MKKYIIPTIRKINISGESVILAGSNPEGNINENGSDEDQLTRRQGGNSIWDTWSN